MRDTVGIGHDARARAEAERGTDDVGRGGGDGEIPTLARGQVDRVLRRVADALDRELHAFKRVRQRVELGAVARGARTWVALVLVHIEVPGGAGDVARARFVVGMGSADPQ